RLAVAIAKSIFGIGPDYQSRATRSCAESCCFQCICFLLPRKSPVGVLHCERSSLQGPIWDSVRSSAGDSIGSCNGWFHCSEAVILGSRLSRRICRFNVLVHCSFRMVLRVRSVLCREDTISALFRKFALCEFLPSWP